MAIHLWIATVSAFVAGQMEDAIHYENTLTVVEGMTDEQYTTTPVVAVR